MNNYFVPRQKNRPRALPKYGPGKYKFEVDYYRQTYFFPGKLAHTRKKLEKSGQEVMYSSKCFYSNYTEFTGYKTRDKLICTSGEGFRNTNGIIKKGTPKSNINRTHTLSTLGFGCYPHKYTCDILSEYLFSCRFKAYSSKN